MKFWLYVIACDLALGHVMAWSAEQIHPPRLFALVCYFVGGLMLGRYFGKVDALARRRERAAYEQ